MKRLHVAPLAALLALTTACGASSVRGGATHAAGFNHHKTMAPMPGPVSAAPVAAGHLVVLSDPGHVTYSTHPAGCHARGATPEMVLPDPSCTPGGIDPAVTQANIASTICTLGGYTKGVRPPVSETSAAKRAQYAAYGIPAGTTSELDHLVSLELGGDNDVANLWPEVGSLPNPKDTVENDLHKAVCSGRVKLADAQQAIAADWVTAEHRLGLK